MPAHTQHRSYLRAKLLSAECAQDLTSMGATPSSPEDKLEQLQNGVYLRRQLIEDYRAYKRTTAESYARLSAECPADSARLKALEAMQQKDWDREIGKTQQELRYLGG